MELLKHFHQLSFLPVNVKELKGFILELAAQGKLTNKWRKENIIKESATDLLHRIVLHNEEQCNLKNRRRKKLSAEPNVQLDLPSTWVQTKNHILFSLIKGKNPKDLSESIKKYPYLDIEALARNNIRRYSNDEKAPKCTDTDILVVCDGSRSGLVLNGKNGIIGSTLAVIETPPFIQDYVRLLFLEGYEKANSNMKGAAIPHLDTKTLLTTDIGLPPLDEQEAIVDTVEALFKEVELLESLTEQHIQLKENYVQSALHELITNSDINTSWNALKPHFHSFFDSRFSVQKLKEAIIQLAIQGKLTAKWREINPTVEPASMLLESIKAEKAQLIKDKKIRTEKPLPPISNEEIPFELPIGWEWCRLTELVYVGTGSTPSKSNSSYYLGGTIPWYTSSATNDLFAKVQNEKITQKAINETNCKVFPQGSLIIALYGQGKTRGQISELVVPGATNQALAAMVFYKSSKCIKKYLKYFFIQNYNEIRALAAGGAQPNLNVGKIKNTLIPVPPREEQYFIVKSLENSIKLCDELSHKIEKNSSIQIDWMKSCLKEVV